MSNRVRIAEFVRADNTAINSRYDVRNATYIPMIRAKSPRLSTRSLLAALSKALLELGSFDAVELSTIL